MLREDCPCLADGDPVDIGPGVACGSPTVSLDANGGSAASQAGHDIVVRAVAAVDTGPSGIDAVNSEPEIAPTRAGLACRNREPERRGAGAQHNGLADPVGVGGTAGAGKVELLGALPRRDQILGSDHNDAASGNRPVRDRIVGSGRRLEPKVLDDVACCRGTVQQG
jgi:hypothetical protein